MAAPKSHADLDRPVAQFLRRDFIALHDRFSVREALDYLRDGTLGEKIIYFYVTEPDGRLVGVVPTRRLLMSAPETRIADIMQTNVVSFSADANLLLACELFVMHRLLALPAVDAAGRLVGIIDVTLLTDEILELSEGVAGEDVFQLIGLHMDQRRVGSPWTSFKNRFPWLLCNIGGGMLCAMLAGAFEHVMSTVIVVAIFMPVVLAIAESVSMQSMTVALQRLHAHGDFRRSLAQALRQEFATAVYIGSAAGAIVGLIAWIWKGAPLVAATIGATIVFAVISSCLIGVAIPSLMQAFRGSAKFAAGPIVLAIADLSTLLFYFSLAMLMLG